MLFLESVSVEATCCSLPVAVREVGTIPLCVDGVKIEAWITNKSN